MGLLNALVDSADRFKDDLLPIGYTIPGQSVWVINIDPAGGEAVVKKKSIDKVPLTPKDRTSSKTSPTLLVDKPSYAVGIPNQEIKSDAKAVATKEHAAFVKLLFDAADATGNLTVKTIATFISDEKNLKSLKFPTIPKKSDLITFQVGSEAWPTDDPAVQRFWETYIQKRLGGEERTCVVCGHHRRTTRIMPFPVKLFGYSPQILSFNESAFCSGGGTKDSPFIASICFSCAGRVPQVLQHLLLLDKNAEGKDANSGRHAVVLARDDAKGGTKQPLRNQVAVFWTKEPLHLVTLGSNHEVDELPRLTLADLEELPTKDQPAYASQLREMLEAPWEGGASRAALAMNRFYLAILSPNKSRLVVREWLEQDIEPVHRNLARYINALQIIHPDGRGIWFPPLAAVLAALQSPTSAKRKIDEKPRLPQVDPDLTRKLIRCMFTGTKPPQALLIRALHCFRIPDPPTDNDQQHERQMLRRMALAAAMKLVLTYDRSEQEERAMEERHTEYDDDSDYKKQSPYLCGCLLAILEAIQARPGKKVNTTLVDRFYGAASTAPAMVFGNLINMATKAHLPKLRRENMETFMLRNGEKVNINDLMTECCDQIDKAGGFPPPLPPEQQAQFALGFYHQRAELRRPKK